MEHSLLQIENLSVEFRRDGGISRAVNGVTLSLDHGHSLGIVGESGSGKSVMVKSVMRLLPKYAFTTVGKILFEGTDISRLSDGGMRHLRGRDIAMVFQDPHAYLNPTKQIGAQLIEPLLFHRVATKAQARAKALQLLEQVGIPSPELRIKQYPFEFSGGMLQRVTIAMALIGCPKLLIADEPTTALDVTVQFQIIRLLLRMQAEMKMAMIFVTHDLVVAAKTCDTILVMYGGAVVERIPSRKLHKECAHPYAQGLIACTPVVRGPVALPEPIGGLPLNLREPLPSGCLFASRCPHAFGKCHSERPPLFRVAGDHEVACFLVEDNKSGVSA
ncbi:MAG: ABC transporter ATP-binding protein [Bacilli bacterium]